MSEKRINPKALRVLDFVVQFWKDFYSSPSIRDIADRFDLSTSIVLYYLDDLENHYLILKREKGLSRQIVPMVVYEILKAGFERMKK